MTIHSLLRRTCLQFVKPADVALGMLIGQENENRFILVHVAAVTIRSLFVYISPQVFNLYTSLGLEVSNNLTRVSDTWQLIKQDVI